MPRFRSASRLCAAALLAVALGVAAGCGPASSESPGQPFYPASEASFRQDEAAQDSALAVLRTLDDEALQNAFAQLSGYAFTRATRTEQLGEEGDPIAFRERVVRYRHSGSARRPVTLRRDSAGTFRFGWLRPLVDSRVEERAPRNPARYVVPEDPPYLSPRNRERYDYRLLADTLLNDRPTQVVALHARPEASGKQTIRRARFYIDRADGHLVGLSLTRVARSMLFDEESRIALRLRPASDGASIPSTLRSDVRIHLPFSAPKRFRTVSTYSDYQPLSPEE